MKPNKDLKSEVLKEEIFIRFREGLYERLKNYAKNTNMNIEEVKQKLEDLNVLWEFEMKEAISLTQAKMQKELMVNSQYKCGFVAGEKEMQKKFEDAVNKLKYESGGREWVLVKELLASIQNNGQQKFPCEREKFTLSESADTNNQTKNKNEQPRTK